MFLMLIVAIVAVIIKRRVKQDFVYLLLVFMALFNFYDVCLSEGLLDAAKDKDERI